MADETTHNEVDGVTVDTTVIETGDGVAVVTAIGEGEGGEPAIEIETESGEGVSDAVAIAAIEADAAVQIAEVNAEVAIASIEAATETREVTWLEIEALQANMQELKSTVENLATALSLAQVDQSTPPASEVLETAEEIAETNSIQPSTLDGTSETVTEVTLENADEKPVTAEVTVTRRRRLI